MTKPVRFLQRKLNAYLSGAATLLGIAPVTTRAARPVADRQALRSDAARVAGDLRRALAKLPRGACGE